MGTGRLSTEVGTGLGIALVFISDLAGISIGFPAGLSLFAVLGEGEGSDRMTAPVPTVGRPPLRSRGVLRRVVCRAVGIWAFTGLRFPGSRFPWSDSFRAEASCS